MPTWKTCISFYGIHAFPSEIQYMSELGVIHITLAQYSLTMSNVTGYNFRKLTETLLYLC